MKRDTFIFYRSFFECIDELPEQNQLDLYRAIFHLSLNFNDTELTGISKTLWRLIKPLIDAANKNYVNGNKPKIKVKNKPNRSQLEANSKPDGSEVEAKPKPNLSEPLSETEGNKDKDKNEDKDVNEDRDKDRDVNKNLGRWWKNATTKILQEKLDQWKTENPGHTYPPLLFTDFFMHYSTPHEENGIRLNQFQSFGIQQKLYEMFTDPNRKGKYVPVVKSTRKTI